MGKAVITAEDLATWQSGLLALAPLSEATVDRLRALLVARELAPGEHLLRAGEQATVVAWVVHGIVREYFVLPDGTERTKAFITEGRITGSAADLLVERSRANIVAEERCRLLTAPYAELLRLQREIAELESYARRFLERLLLAKAEREYELLGLDAEARYRAFRQQYPGLEARVAARHVASYIGITPVHLSRLRRRALDRNAAGRS